MSMNMQVLFQQDDPIRILRQQAGSLNGLQKQEIYWELEAKRLSVDTDFDCSMMPEVRLLLGTVEEKPIEKYQTLFWQALGREDPISALRHAVISLRGEGISKGMILSQLEALRKQVANSREEDIISEVMDSLVGWCRPHMRIN